MKSQEWKSQNKKWKNFLKSNIGREIIWLDYCGYHLADSQYDLTIPQRLFLTKGRMELHKEMNKVKK